MYFDCPVVIPYYGGKFTMSKRLVEMMPLHKRYIEVFAGGASMFFRKKKADWNVLNDLDNDIVNLYICVLKEFEELTKHIYWYPRSRTLFDKIFGYQNRWECPSNILQFYQLVPPTPQSLRRLILLNPPYMALKIWYLRYQNALD